MVSEDIEFRVLRVCESFDGCYVCEEYIEMDGVERPLKDILRENVEQQATINKQEQIITILKQEMEDAQKLCEILSDKLKGWNNG